MAIQATNFINQNESLQDDEEMSRLQSSQRPILINQISTKTSVENEIIQAISLAILSTRKSD